MDTSVLHPDELQAALAAKGEPGPAAGTEPGEPQRPPYTYVALISMAIRDSPEQCLSLRDICAYIAERFPYYSGERSGGRRGWMKCVRRSLSINPCFQRLPGGGGRGGDWALDPDLFHDLRNCRPRRPLPEGQSRRRRRPSAPQSPQSPPAAPAPAPAPAPTPVTAAAPAPAPQPPVCAPHAVPSSLPTLLLLPPRCPHGSWAVKELPGQIPPHLLEALGLMPGELGTRAAPASQ